MRQMTSPLAWTATVVLLVLGGSAPHVQAFVPGHHNDNYNNQITSTISHRRTTTAVSAQPKRFNFVADGFSMQDQMQVLSARLAAKTTTTTSSGAVQEQWSPISSQADTAPPATVAPPVNIKTLDVVTEATTTTTSTETDIEMERAKLQAAVEHAKQALREFEERHGTKQNTVAVKGLEKAVPETPVMKKSNGRSIDPVVANKPPPVSETTTAGPSDVTSPFLPLVSGSVTEQRNTQVLRASKDGKSRWGESEVKRIMEGPVSQPVTGSDEVESLAETIPSNAKAQFLPLVSGSLVQQRNTQVLRAAKAGKSRWGQSEVKRIMEGPVSEEPAKTTAKSSGTAATSPSGQPSFTPLDPEALKTVSLFEQRNKQIIDAASAGKSRWGSWEIEKAKEQIALKEALAVGQSTNWGATITKETEEKDTIQESLESEVMKNMSLFERRNKQIINAAAAGKSRWGDLEVEKVKDQVALREALELL
eukprot:scaffold162_cov176-Amphora_coffeaeformis.AAC.58